MDRYLETIQHDGRHRITRVQITCTDKAEEPTMYGASALDVGAYEGGHALVSFPVDWMPFDLAHFVSTRFVAGTSEDYRLLWPTVTIHGTEYPDVGGSVAEWHWSEPIIAIR